MYLRHANLKKKTILKQLSEALYLDESVSLDEILQFSDQKSFAMLFPVCQLTVVLLQPENTSEAAEFWNFILNFVIDSP